MPKCDFNKVAKATGGLLLYIFEQVLDGLILPLSF